MSRWQQQKQAQEDLKNVSRRRKILEQAKKNRPKNFAEARQIPAKPSYAMRWIRPKKKPT